jgi:hypothetical protein
MKIAQQVTASESKKMNLVRDASSNKDLRKVAIFRSLFARGYFSRDTKTKLFKNGFARAKFTHARG